MIGLSVGLSIAASLLVCWVHARLWRRQIRRQAGTDALVVKLKTEIDRLVTELNGTTERNIGLIEDRIRSLGNLIERAGRTATVLEAEADRREQSDRIYTSLARSRPLSIDVEQEKPSRREAETDFEALTPREKALVLYRNGEDPDAIGSRLDMSRGEVELIISLHERRR